MGFETGAWRSSGVSCWSLVFELWSLNFDSLDYHGSPSKEVQRPKIKDQRPLFQNQNPLPSVVRWQRALDSFERLSKAKFNTPEHNRQPTARTIDVHGRGHRGCDVFYRQSLWRFYTRPVRALSIKRESSNENHQTRTMLLRRSRSSWLHRSVPPAVLTNPTKPPTSEHAWRLLKSPHPPAMNARDCTM